MKPLVWYGHLRKITAVMRGGTQMQQFAARVILAADNSITVQEQNGTDKLGDVVWRDVPEREIEMESILRALIEAHYQ